jgi:uncharacterized protein (DUF927 family)
MARRKKNAGAEAVKDAIENAAPAEASPVETPFSGPETLLRRFKMLETGLHLRKDDGLLWICAPFKISAETQDEAGRWGVLLEWQDRDGLWKSEVFSRELFAGDCREVRNRLAAGGLTISGYNAARTAFVEYLNLARASARARVVERTGWHEVNGRRLFVLPDRVVGAVDERVILQADRDKAPFGRAGSLDAWRGKVAMFACANSRLTFSVSLAFAGPLLHLADEDGGGFNLRGQSRTGKTTALRLAASVWGAPLSFMRNWRATLNGLESVAAQYSDALLPLDEMGQVDPKELGNTAYLLANGSGKSRSGRDGSARPPARWRLLFLSTGEIGLSDKAAETRQSTKAGQEMRLIDLPADAGAGFGVFEEIHGFDSPGKLADELRGACRQAHGVAGVAFLEMLAERMEREPDFAENLRAKIDHAASRVLLAKIEDVGGQVNSAARRFALVGVAGEMATQAGITSWPEGEAIRAVQVMFAAWLKERGTTGASEDERAKRQLAAFLSRHGASRFELWGEQSPSAQVPEDESSAPPTEKVRPRDRAGWRRYMKQDDGRYGFRYYMTREAMGEALTGLDFRAAVLALANAGMILKDKNGKSAVSVKPPGIEGGIRLYAVPSDVIDYGTDE